jgi:hypothetical protein
MSEASVPDQSESICDKLIALAGNEQHNVKTSDRVDNRYRLGQHDAHLERTLEWRGPVAFARAHGSAPGVDHHFGTRWGSNADQRVSLRVEVGRDAGLLYAYDPTWDEYAVIGSDVPFAVVKDAFTRSLKLVEHPWVEDFVALLPAVTAIRRSLEPEL